MSSILRKYREFIAYAAFGGAGTLVNWIIYAALVESLYGNMALSNAISWCIAVTFSFFVNKILVFKSNSWRLKVVAKEGISFLGARIFTGIAEVIMPSLLYSTGIRHDMFEVKGLGSKIIVSIVFGVINYGVSKLVFLKREKATEAILSSSDDSNIRTAEIYTPQEESVFAQKVS